MFLKEWRQSAQIQQRLIDVEDESFPVVLFSGRLDTSALLEDTSSGKQAFSRFADFIGPAEVVPCYKTHRTALFCAACKARTPKTDR